MFERSTVCFLVIEAIEDLGVSGFLCLDCSREDESELLCGESLFRLLRIPHSIHHELVLREVVSF